MFAISKVNPDGTLLYLKSTKRTKMVSEGRFKTFSKKETAEYWLKELKLDDCSITSVNVEKPKKTRSIKPNEPENMVNENEPIEDDDPNFDPEYLFKTINKQCENCKKTCKQSGKADVIRCLDYKNNKIN